MPGFDALRYREGVFEMLDQRVLPDRCLYLAFDSAQAVAAAIRAIHRRWLKEIYEWAGEYRRVNVSKGEFLFAAAARIPDLMGGFERSVLARYFYGVPNVMDLDPLATCRYLNERPATVHEKLLWPERAMLEAVARL